MRTLRLLFVLSAVCIGTLGFSQEVHKCGAPTTKGTPCKIRVKVSGAKCHHHAGNGSENATVWANGATKVIHTCGALTAKGTACKRRVKIAGAKCYSHE